MNKKLCALMLTLVLVAGLLAACGGASSSAAVSGDGSAAGGTSQSAPAPANGMRSITDMAGREMEIPAEVNRVFSTHPLSAIYLYTLAPDKLLGWNYELNELEGRFMPPEYRELPNFGMNDAMNYEAVIAAGPDFALAVTKLNEAGMADADALSQKLGIPVVMVSDNLQDTAEVYRFVGQLIGEEARAEALAAYVDETFADMQAADIPQEERVTVYYGNGPDSLETAPPGSIHSQIIDVVNGVNVAEVELGDSSRVQITLEQVLDWNPDVIIVNGEPREALSGNGAAQTILESPDWATIQAVQDGRVYGAPKSPFSWIDRPAGPNRIIGVRWLANLLYPEYFDYDIDAEVREFYSLFYHVELTDAQLQELHSD